MRATTTEVTAQDVFGFVAPEPSIAHRLNVDPTGLEMRQRANGNWCLQVGVRRLLAKKNVFFTFRPGAGALQPVKSC